MPISRSQMRRQLRKQGGIMEVEPRENFGLGSSLKKRIRKLIPNEVAKVATTVAPFVAPFNPAVAAAMAGIGGFDQTGSISDSLKGAALTYGLGQGARFIGGAGFQGNPFTEGGAFRGGLEGFKSGFSSPLGTETGLGKMLSENAAAKGKALKAEGVKPVKESTFFEDATQELLPGDTVSTITKDTIIQNDPSIFELVKQGDYGDALMTGAKKFGKAMFTNKDGTLDKTAVLAAASFGLTYADALRIANEAGEELPKEEYDEALKAEYKAKNDEYLKNFFGGKADGGRIGFEKGTAPAGTFSLQEYINFLNAAKDFDRLYDKGEKIVGEAGEFVKSVGDKEYEDLTKKELLKEKEIEDAIEKLEDKFIKTEDDYYNRTKDLPADVDAMGAYARELIRDLNRRDRKLDMLAEIAGLKDGGRIGYARGSIDNESEDIKKLKKLISGDIIENGDPDMDEMKEKMGIEELMAGTGINFSRQEKSYLFRRLGGSGGADRSYTMPNLYRILSNPSRYPEDARILKEIAVMGLNKKDGGRIGFEKGANKDYEFMKLIDTSDADRKEKAINDALEMYRKEYPRMSEEDIFTLVMQEFAPNMQSLQDDGSYKKASELPTPKIKLGDKIEDRVDLIKKTDGGVGPQTSLSLRMNLLNDLVKDGTITKKQYEDALLKGSAFVEEDGYRVRLGPFDFTGRGGEKITKMIDKYEDYDNYAMGGEVPVRKNQGGVMELDYRETGGFVPVGIKERADDVPAMLSKNEFVMTADAVRGIGNGDVEKGAEKLYGVMKQAEKVGRA